MKFSKNKKETKRISDQHEECKSREIGGKSVTFYLLGLTAMATVISQKQWWLALSLHKTVCHHSVMDWEQVPVAMLYPLETVLNTGVLGVGLDIDFSCVFFFWAPQSPKENWEPTVTEKALVKLNVSQCKKGKKNHLTVRKRLVRKRGRMGRI